MDEEIQQATDRALGAALPIAGSWKNFIYSPSLDPTSSAFETKPLTEGAAKTMADLINACLKDEMRRDERVIIFGEDVADCSREEYLKQKQVKGKGGVFKLTANLQCERFPGDLIGPVYFEGTLSRQPLRYEADRLWVPEEPGLGVCVP